ncbi:MAG: hypothetical protein ACHQHN_08010 [Sphingobacteriales bacterium]
MKKILALSYLAMVLYGFETRAQTVSPQDSVKAVKQGEKSSSAASQDVLTNYLQVLTQNLTSNADKGIQLKLNWFALNNKDSVHKYNNDYYRQTTWQRNGQFLFGGGIDKNNKFNSVQAGFSYNLLNRRDIALTYYDKTYAAYFSRESVIIHLARLQFAPAIDSALRKKLTILISGLYQESVQNGHAPVDSLKDKINAAITGLPLDDVVIAYDIKNVQLQLNADIKNTALTGSTLTRALQRQIRALSANLAGTLFGAAVTAYVSGMGKSPLSLGTFASPAQLKAITLYIDRQVADDSVLQKLKPKNLSDLNTKILSAYDALVQYTAHKPLLTINYTYTYGTETVLSSHIASLQYVQGLTRLASPKTGELTASLSDTLSGNDPSGKVRNFGRDILALQAGYNKILALQKKVSVMEINAGAEEDIALSGYTVQTNKSTFYFNAYYRVRLPATPWLKLAIKYDPKRSNVLGLLDFTYNLDQP